jgi:hypothetical protein
MTAIQRQWVYLIIAGIVPTGTNMECSVQQRVGTKPTEASANVLGSMSPSMTGGDAVRARLRISARTRAELRQRHDCDQANTHPFGMSSSWSGLS